MTLPADTPGLFIFRRRLSTSSLHGQRLQMKIVEFRDANGGLRPGDPNRLSLRTSILSLNFCFLVYQHGKDLESPKFLPSDFGENEIKISKHLWDEPTDTHCYLCKSEDRLLISFKGTESVQNMKTDMDMQKTHITSHFKKGIFLDDRDAFDFKFAQVHRGFSRAYPWIRAEMDIKPRSLFLTGHSLGGGLA
eukprot:CAMPEP_0174908382 /NCGR_PEP_ID=MMETSP0167-20121228/64627_1 /TAXON_ID=38298 /ORGANISM="Rhodella maculata, Strain CCMP736" /LENGTH=191 /DNA_ID=CAMNT_0016152129 /DNA_START=49 /DNA_END=621 /DNA_ORIENTATION=-